jgi:hypothetical protein
MRPANKANSADTKRRAADLRRYAPENNSMKLRKHIRLLIFVSLAWLLFWIAGLPEYYQQYSNKFMVIFDLVILPPIWLIKGVIWLSSL